MNRIQEASVVIFAFALVLLAILSQMTLEYIPDYPFIVLVLLASIATFYAVEPSKRTFQFSLGLILVLAVLLRVFIFYSPPSLIGFDPDKYAMFAELAVSGDGVQSGFYSKAPLFHLYIGITSVIMVVPVDTALGIYLFAVGIIAPLVTALIVREFESGQEQHAAILSAGLVAVGPMMINISYWPAAQTPATLLLLLAIWMIVRGDIL